MKIKTLAEILAESDSDSASTPRTKPKKHTKFSKQSHRDEPKKPRKTGKRFVNSDKNRSKTNRSTHNLSATNHLEDSDSVINEDMSDIASNDSPSSANQKTSKPKKYKKREKRFHPAANFSPEPSNVPAYQQPKAQSIKEMLEEVKQGALCTEEEGCDNSDGDGAETGTISHQGETNKQTDNLPAALKAYLRTPEQRQAEVDEVKAESRLRWLAFYYLSRREYGKAELKQKLIDKGQEPEKIDALLDEFEEKGYQSDYRTTLMLIRENIRKGRGRGRIKQEFYRKSIAMPSNIDELIDMANAESDEFSEFVDDSDDNLVEGVDWLKLAVIARTKKYGDGVPLEQKDKARQLRFLQYRGFNTDICFAALNYTLETLDERF
ncbi:MAG: regulatory protein RecX [Psychrobacter sp.]|uniref:regulatory protein RecX n=1 Tax=unclassified Psychrobacter TaxID=196806 RepID=UPI0018662137|nr:regulatory protein RecX [Psychrobacter sp. FME61]